MKYETFLQRANASFRSLGVQPSQEIISHANGLMAALNTAITMNSPVLRELPPGIPIDRDTEIDQPTATDALARIAASRREQHAAFNFSQLLNEQELMTFDELLGLVGENLGNRAGLRDAVLQRPYMSEISASSPLFALIKCIREQRGDYTEVMLQELDDNQRELEPTAYTNDVVRLVDNFESLLQECLTSGAICS